VDTNTAILHHRTNIHQDLHIEFRGVDNVCKKVLLRSWPFPILYNRLLKKKVKQLLNGIYSFFAHPMQLRMSVWKIIFKIQLLKMEEMICFICIQYDDDVLGDVLKVLGEDLKLKSHLINNVYETGQ
jgi:hypothetical protein